MRNTFYTFHAKKRITNPASFTAYLALVWSPFDRLVVVCRAESFYSLLIL